MQDALPTHAAVKEQLLAEPFWGQNETLDTLVPQPRDQRLRGKKQPMDHAVCPLQRARMILNETS